MICSVWNWFRNRYADHKNRIKSLETVTSVYNLLAYNEVINSL